MATTDDAELLPVLREMLERPRAAAAWAEAARMAREGRLRDFTLRIGHGTDGRGETAGFWHDDWSEADTGPAKALATAEERFEAEVYVAAIRGAAAVVQEDSIDPAIPLDCAALLTGLRSCPEYRAEHLAEAFPDPQPLLDAFTNTLARAEFATPGHRDLCRVMLYMLYDACPSLRPEFRGLLAHFFGVYGRGGRSARHALISPVLQVLGLILPGMDPQSDSADAGVLRELVLTSLVPLHATNEMTLWRDQVPVLQEFHDDLVYCIVAALDQMALADAAHGAGLDRVVRMQAEVIEKVLEFWPDGYSSNTPKQVRLLHEIEMLLTHTVPEPAKPVAAAAIAGPSASSVAVFRRVREQVVLHLCMVLKGENFRPLERVLFMWKNPKFVALLAHPEHSAAVTTPFLAALVRREDHWNPTVNRMSKLVLTKLREANAEAFEAAAEQLFGAGKETQQGAPTRDAGAKPSATAATAPPEVNPKKRPSPGLPPPFHSPASLDRGDPAAKPLRARSGARSLNPAVQNLLPRGAVGRGKQPPVTITGVAPWAFSPARQAAARPSGRSKGGRRVAPGLGPSAGLGAMLEAPKENSVGELEEDDIPVAQGKPNDGAPHTELGSFAPSGGSSSAGSGLAYVLAYLARLAPDDEGEGDEPWHAATLAPTPTLLPSLKFHDLVWGPDLGSGAFSTVRYARQVLRGEDGSATTGRSQWPEFAVKCIRREKIKELGLEMSVTREMAILRMLSHPGVARMVSAFRYRGGAYLVLEYASLGDLHGLVSRLGALDEDVTRFVVGSVAAAVLHLHDHGFTYGDLKPENVLLLQTGHVKITDFGACRPFSQAALERLKVEMHAALALRSGDWKADEETAEDFLGDAASLEEMMHEMQTQETVEGTVAYLAPEMLRGARASTKSDAFALGCVFYRCLAGQPPQWGADMDQVAARQVRFAGQTEDERFPATSFSAAARGACEALLRPGAEERLGLEALAEDPFFRKAPRYKDIQRLHGLAPTETPDMEALSEAAAAAAGADDAEWNQRAFSKIWAPLPTKFAFGDSRVSVPVRADASQAMARGEAHLKRIGFGLRHDKLRRMGFPVILEGPEQGASFAGGVVAGGGVIAEEA